MTDVLPAALLLVQLAAASRVVWRLLPGRRRLPPVAPRATGPSDTTVTVVVATLNEAHRIGPCLAGLQAQGLPLLETLIVDSRSTDGTRDLVEAAGRQDPRIRLLTDAPLPPGWVGKVWALETGLRHARGDWVLGLDADIEPTPGLIGAVVTAASGCRVVRPEVHRPDGGRALAAAGDAGDAALSGGCHRIRPGRTRARDGERAVLPGPPRRPGAARRVRTGARLVL
jgi:glycosyltransferase involved in cell wall biosynthesis